jgi:hypothetical protein
MPIPSDPAIKWKRPFATDGGRATIPDTKQVPGRASQTEGFPEETQKPLKDGGLAPNRLDFNGLFYILALHQFFQQSGGIYSWTNTLNYSHPALVFHNGQLWFCLLENGPDSSRGAVTPGTNEAVWRQFLFWLADSIGGGGSGGGGGGGAGLPDEVVSLFGGNPVGTLIHYYGSTAPLGYLPCNGQSFSATQYPKLYAFLGGSVTPDLRGMFLRCTGGAAGGVRSVQQDAGRNVTGTYPFGQDANLVPGGYQRQGTGAFGSGEAWSDNDSFLSEIVAPGATAWFPITFDASKVWGSAHTAGEFRPVNAAVLICIRHD